MVVVEADAHGSAWVTALASKDIPCVASLSEEGPVPGGRSLGKQMGEAGKCLSHPRLPSLEGSHFRNYFRGCDIAGESKTALD